MKITVNGLKVVDNKGYNNNDLFVGRPTSLATAISGVGFTVVFNHDSTIYITVSPRFASKVVLFKLYIITFLITSYGCRQKVCAAYLIGIKITIYWLLIMLLIRP